MDWQALRVSLSLGLFTVVVLLPFGLWLGHRLATRRFRARLLVEAAQARQAATDKRARLARESRAFFEKSFRLGETDLPTRLRIEGEATEAERQAARSRIELAAAISAWRQTLGLLPQ